MTLLSAGLLLSDLNKQNNFEAFDDRLNLLVETLIGGKVDSSDGITVVTSIGDPDFFNHILVGIGKLIKVIKRLAGQDRCGIRFYT